MGIDYKNLSSYQLLALGAKTAACFGSGVGSGVCNNCVFRTHYVDGDICTEWAIQHPEEALALCGVNAMVISQEDGVTISKAGTFIGNGKVETQGKDIVEEIRRLEDENAKLKAECDRWYQDNKSATCEFMDMKRDKAVVEEQLKLAEDRVAALEVSNLRTEAANETYAEVLRLIFGRGEYSEEKAD